MVKTRSSAGCPHASSSSAQKNPPRYSSSSAAPRKNRRRRIVAMPERKRKLRRQQALQKQSAIAKASQPLFTEEIGKRNSKSNRNSRSTQPFLSSKPSDELRPDPPCQKSTRKSFKNDKNYSLASTHSRKASKKRAIVTVEEEEENPTSTEECRKFIITGEERNQDALFQATCKKVRISEAADACSSECDHDQVVEVNGWTSEQDLALQSAYFQVRPSSNFWFEVSKKISGKTAKDCFDRFYSAHPTPPTTQPRSRKLAAQSPVRAISFSSPMVRFGRGKQGLLKAHQTVRHILRQQRVADGTYEADVFTAVEQLNSRKPLLQDFTNRAISPLPALKGKDTSSESLVGTPASCFGDAKSEHELWWSISSKQKPRSCPDENTYTTRSTTKSQLLSPEVLKAECNPGRLDRFLDILHLRRGEKRKNASAKGALQGNQGNPKAEKTFAQCVAAARAAVITDATEILKTMMQQKSTQVEEEASFLSDHLEEESSLMSA